MEQYPWLQNKTIKENILFGLPYDSKRYNDIIMACDLTNELDILPSRDETQIGLKGITLSEGQKTKVCLARAIYVNADTIVADDSFATLSEATYSKVFSQVFKNLLKFKTRILVTNSVASLQQADRIFVIENGRIAAVGTPSELKTNMHFITVLQAARKLNMKQDYNEDNKLMTIEEEDSRYAGGRIPNTKLEQESTIYSKSTTSGIVIHNARDRSRRS